MRDWMYRFKTYILVAENSSSHMKRGENICYHLLFNCLPLE
jgi:hypothetical protein